MTESIPSGSSATARSERPSAEGKPVILTCVDCHEEFTFPKSAREYFEEKGYAHDPKRCKACHHNHKLQKAAEQNLRTENQNLPDGLMSLSNYQKDHPRAR
ncbi:MAG: zinc-ribbon domain containing protein [Patescibacteria group bacterium]